MPEPKGLNATRVECAPLRTGYSSMTSKKTYDCGKCPGYCCSYPLIEVSKTDIGRLAKHFDLDYAAAEERFTLYDKEEKVRGLRKQKDEFFGTVCR